MLINKVKKIIVFGGGTSGWLTAAYLVKNLQIPVEIILIEDSKLGPIGVGEGTQPFTAQFLYQCGIHPHMWMKDSNASFKLGVELVGWNKETYFVDNDSTDNCVIAEDFYTSDYFINKPYTEFRDWHPAYQLAKANKSIKLDEGLDITFGMGMEGYGAVHFAAFDIIKTIKNLILDKITYVDTSITEVKQDMHGITKLVSVDGAEYSADLYLDCTGFKSLLIGEALKVPFESYTDWLPCDRAVAMPTQYTDPVKECFPYTRSTAMNAGWRWTIPVFNRVGNGYVYSSKHITDEQAEQELRQATGNFDTPVNFVKFRSGRHKDIAYKNVVAVGLSAGFVEPLEATGITFTTAIVKSVSDLLNLNKNIWNNEIKFNLNKGFYQMAMEILAFVWIHYHFSEKDDTPFWKDIRNQKMSMLPKDVQFILSHFYPLPKRFLFFSQGSMFNIVQWFSVLHAGGAYKNASIPLDERRTKYAEYFIDAQQKRIDMAKELFPSQYDYLKEWYNENN